MNLYRSKSKKIFLSNSFLTYPKHFSRHKKQLLPKHSIFLLCHNKSNFCVILVFMWTHLNFLLLCLFHNLRLSPNIDTMIHYLLVFINTKLQTLIHWDSCRSHVTCFLTPHIHFLRVKKIKKGIEWENWHLTHRQKRALGDKFRNASVSLRLRGIVKQFYKSHFGFLVGNPPGKRQKLQHPASFVHSQINPMQFKNKHWCQCSKCFLV